MNEEFPRGGGGPPYKSDGGDRRKFLKQPIKGTSLPEPRFVGVAQIYFHP